MDQNILAAQLESGRSIEAIAREPGRPPSTVAYWVNKHGLASVHAGMHAPRGGDPARAARGARRGRPDRPGDRRACRNELRDGAALAEEARARETGRAGADRAARRDGSHQLRGSVRRPRLDAVREVQRGRPPTLRALPHGRGRRRRRRTVKALLVEEAGGRCVLCGYDRYRVRSSSTISIRSGRPFGLVGVADRRARARALRARRPASACSSARTATRRSRQASPTRPIAPTHWPPSEPPCPGELTVRGSSIGRASPLLSGRLWVRVPPPELARKGRGRSALRGPRPQTAAEHKLDSFSGQCVYPPANSTWSRLLLEEVS